MQTSNPTRLPQARVLQTICVGIILNRSQEWGLPLGSLKNVSQRLCHHLLDQVDAASAAAVNCLMILPSPFDGNSRHFFWVQFAGLGVQFQHSEEISLLFGLSFPAFFNSSKDTCTLPGSSPLWDPLVICTASGSKTTHPAPCIALRYLARTVRWYGLV